MKYEPVVNWGVSKVLQEGKEYFIVLCKLDFSLLGWKVSDEIIEIVDEGANFKVRDMQDNVYILDKTIFNPNKVAYLHTGLLSDFSNKGYNVSCRLLDEMSKFKMGV